MRNPTSKIQRLKEGQRPKAEPNARGTGGVLECLPVRRQRTGGGQRSALPLWSEGHGLPAGGARQPPQRNPLDCNRPLSWSPRQDGLGFGPSAAQAAHSKPWRQTLALGLLSIVHCLPSSAQYALDWWTADGGGGTSTGGVYSVTGTIGQADTGPVLSGGPFTLVGGFWGVIAAVQTPGAPYLSVLRTATNTVMVSWPLAGAEGWVLQATNALPCSGTACTEIPPPCTTSGTDLVSTEAGPAGKKCYLLRKP